ncbi:formate dehydrogenase subunit delta [Micromonospora olivasterospora]|uniref:Formate dehydrogenase subunit delta n=1 Tax=Micromonospora olivasterospora TaxID=1880 RepID=A0A562IJM4_MICOL|nr:formate dehydrogenase subunit delta [Micromonospora olivasterospora]TWH70824.1 formate dehydrogenase subunit delta [Micromonospora olivasterospora]
MSALTTPPHVRMANDISRQFRHRPQEEAVTAVADHIRRFWPPRLRAALLAHIDQGGDGLDPIAVAAAARLPEAA